MPPVQAKRASIKTRQMTRFGWHLLKTAASTIAKDVRSIHIRPEGAGLMAIKSVLEMVQDMGTETVVAMTGGFAVWRDAGVPVVQKD